MSDDERNEIVIYLLTLRTRSRLVNSFEIYYYIYFLIYFLVCPTLLRPPVPCTTCTIQPAATGEQRKMVTGTIGEIEEENSNSKMVQLAKQGTCT